MCSQSTIDKLNDGKMVALPVWTGVLRIINPIAFISLVFYLGSYKVDVESKSFSSAREKDDYIHQIEANTKHSSSIASHMPFEKQIQVFVPRSEMEYKFEVVLQNQKKIMKKLNIN